MPNISAQELADLVPCPLGQVQRLIELGILESRDGDGCFDSSQVHLVRERIGEARRQLQPAEAGAENHNVLLVHSTGT